jgi:transcriptional regulator with XRE-family HTH domain
MSETAPDSVDTTDSPRRVAFGRRLRDLRKQAGRSQADVAESGGMSRPFYVDVENGKRNISLDKVFDLADTFDVDVAVLFTDLSLNPPKEADR